MLVRDVHAPAGVVFSETDWLIVVSHDCDVVNGSIEKEPTVEVIRAEEVGLKSVDKQQAWGRNPRVLRLDAVDDRNNNVVLRLKVHERWTLPRELLCNEAPARFLDDKGRRLIAEWLAKRYIRAAFPTAFDVRWRSRMRDWVDLLEKHSRWIQGVYLRLNILKELTAEIPYKVHLIVVAPALVKKDSDWPTKLDELDRDVERFWTQFKPGIECAGVDVLGTDQVTLAEIERYQRFDADWVSFADDSPATPLATEMTA
ncbi:MAG: hypothetical protein SGI86_20130 [Deltaproteobacteria bacterium]|nr:hypothetical protein [Deltaproteobacteria bacterium]